MDELAEWWGNSAWEAAYFNAAIPAAQMSSPCDVIDATEKWLDVILSPGLVYESRPRDGAIHQGTWPWKEESDGATRGSSLADSICSILASSSRLDRSTSGGKDYEQPRSSSEMTLKTASIDCSSSLRSSAAEAVPLVLGTNYYMVWVVCADFAPGIRQCSPLESYYTITCLEKGDEDVKALGLDGPQLRRGVPR